MGLDLDVESVITDFELNIQKAVDDLLPNAKILGCFFHFKKAIWQRVQKKGMSKRFDVDQNFKKFIQECGALAHLPLEKLQNGLDYIKNHFTFKDEEASRFKDYMMKYMQEYWMEGVFPPHVWSCWGRSEDLTNNNQEGFNHKINTDIPQVHPPPALLLCYIKAELTMGAIKLLSVRNGQPQPAQNPRYKNLAQKRLNQKKIFQESEDIPAFLATMGHNLGAAMLMGNKKRYLESRAKKSIPQTDIDTSTWHAQEEPVLEVMEDGENPYENRVIGITKKGQEKISAEDVPLTKKKCPSCGKGFNRTSKVISCHSCDSDTHIKLSCLPYSYNKSQFVCNKCHPQVRNAKPSSTTTTSITRVDGVFKCKLCKFISKTKFSLKRHIETIHGGNQEKN